MNDITGDVPYLTQDITIQNSDEISDQVDTYIRGEVFKTLDIDAKKSGISSFFGNTYTDPSSTKATIATKGTEKQSVTDTTRQPVYINHSNTYFIPTYDAVERVLTKWLHDQKIEPTEDMKAGIAQIASNTNVAYLNFAEQLAAPERDVLKSIDDNYIKIFIIAIVLLLFLIVSIVLYRKKRLTLILCILGFFITVAVVSLPLSNALATKLYTTNFEIDTSAVQIDDIDPKNYSLDIIDSPAKPAYLEPFGSIDIDSQGIHQSITESTSDKALQETAGHYSFSAWPGELGPVVIAGHNNSSQNGIWVRDFGKIYFLEPGDLFTIKVPYGTYTYKVISKHVEAAATYPIREKLVDKSKRWAILYSCYPIDSGDTPDRTFVEAEQISGPIIRENEEE